MLAKGLPGENLRKILDRNGDPSKVCPEHWQARVRRLRVHHSVCGGRSDSTVGDHGRRRHRKTLEIKGAA